MYTLQSDLTMKGLGPADTLRCRALIGSAATGSINLAVRPSAAFAGVVVPFQYRQI